MYRQLIVAILFALISGHVSAHHNWSVDYDNTNIVEIEGVVSSIAWRNPHVRFQVIVDGGTDQEKTWNIAGTSVSNLARMDVTKEILSIGDKVRMAGHAAQRSDHGMYMINLLLPDGREAIFSGSAKPRWGEESIGSAANLRGELVEEDVSKRPDSIFSVWVTLTGDPGSRSLQPRNTEDYPLSEAGLAKIASYNPETDDPFGSCSPKGGSAIMNAPYPVELVDQGDRILFKLEEYDTRRTIHLTDIHDDQNIEPSLLGYSTGRWQDDTLVVTTTKIDYPFLHVGAAPDFIPQGQYAQTQETFKLGAERDRLYYTLTVTDTEMLTKPMVYSKYFVWRSGEEVKPFDCDEVGLYVTE